MSTTRRRIVVDDSPLARSIGARIREHRLRAGLSQQKLAEGRYTKAYVSALETGSAKPSMAALNFLASRLGTTAADLLADPDPGWTLLEADLRLASGDPEGAADAYAGLLDTATEPRVRAELLRGLAEALCQMDRPAEAIRAAAESAELFGILRRPVDRALAVYWLACAQHQHDNPDEARTLLSALLEEVRAGLVVAPDFELRVLIALGSTETYRGSHRAAVGYLEEARASSVELDDRRRGVVLISLANSYRGAGDHEAAIRFGSQALALLRAAAAELETAVLESSLALAYLAIGSSKRAMEMVTEAKVIAGRFHDGRLLAHLADTEAQIVLAEGDLGQALGLAETAIERAAAAGNQKALVDASVTRARALLQLGRTEDALASFERAAELARMHSPAPRLREVLRAWADALAAAGRHEEAFTVARAALATDDQAVPDIMAMAAPGVPA
jgi:tetratricopeptide (TPR) repeat protein